VRDAPRATQYIVINSEEVFMIDIRSMILAETSRTVAIRRDLHQIPETAFNEHKTSAFVAERLRTIGLEVRSGIAGTGVVGLLRGSRPGPTVMLRADMDALPMTEATGLSFASSHEGVMHACGHDGHMAIALGAAAVLTPLRELLSGNVKFVFQPAEEGPGGAKPMIEEGILKDPDVDVCVGCHLWPAVPAGYLGVKPGPLMAAMDRFDLTITGLGGHGAMPHLCIDALETATQVVSVLQRLVSRKMDPLSPSVVTVGSFHSGSTFNVIPSQAELSGTTRTFDRQVWTSWPERMETVIRGVCEAMGAGYDFHYVQGYPPVVNDEQVAAEVRTCAVEVVGEDRLMIPDSTMGGEDIAFYMEQVPGCFFFIGAGHEKGEALHNPGFDFNEEALDTGIEVLCRFVLGRLSAEGR